MAPPTEADLFLLKQIKAGHASGWTQLVERYQGRMLAFAANQLATENDAEDLVQDTFLLFLKGIHQFRAETTLETYLFTILRRKIIDTFRGRQYGLCSLNQINSSTGTGALTEKLDSGATSASWYARKLENQALVESALHQALEAFVQQLQTKCDFNQLKLAELIFFAQLRNKEIAKVLKLDEGQVALQRHRFLKKLQAQLPQDLASQLDDVLQEELFAQRTLLTDAWERLRPSCPKRSTIGKYYLGTLDDQWEAYLDFHINVLGCRFCAANLTDIQSASERKASSSVLRDRILSSTVGFLKS